MADSTSGFKVMQRQSEAAPWIVSFVANFTGTLTKGDLVKITSGKADLATTAATTLVGTAMETKALTSSVTRITVNVAPDQIYAVYDTAARNFGDLLDLAGATGAMTIAAASNNDLRVVGKSADLQWTYVVINRSKHLLTV